MRLVCSIRMTERCPTNELNLCDTCILKIPEVQSMLLVPVTLNLCPRLSQYLTLYIDVSVESRVVRPGPPKTVLPAAGCKGGLAGCKRLVGTMD